MIAKLASDSAAAGLMEVRAGWKRFLAGLRPGAAGDRPKAAARLAELGPGTCTRSRR
jgi:hypothetical protein